MCGISAYNFKQHVASDIGTHGNYLPAENAKSQEYLNKIQHWTTQNKMLLNDEKCKYMVFNFTRKYQFSSRFYLNNNKLEEISECRLLGVVLTNNLSFEKNTESIVKNAYKRMIMLHKLSQFGISVADMLNIYVLYIRSVVEQSCVVWHSSVTE